MKRRICFTIAIVSIVAVISLTRSDSTVTAQNQLRVVADTGLVTLGPGQILRITVNGMAGNDTFAFRFRQREYAQTDCNAGVCKFALVSQTMSDLQISVPNEGSKVDFMGTNAAGSVAVLSNTRIVRVNAMIIDQATGQVDSIQIGLLIP